MSAVEFEYDIGLSFAGEQREYVTLVARELLSRDIEVFFDDYERGTLWGKDLYAHLTDVYQHKCKFCVIFVSKEYASKVWTNVERKSAQARAVQENQEYILPARFDDTPIPGLLNTVGYVDLNEVSQPELVDLISEKVGKKDRKEYLPANLDRLFELLGIEEDKKSQVQTRFHARSFFDVLRRMTEQERNVVVNLMLFGCPAELPEYIHINADLLRRVTEESIAQLKQILGDIRSLGFRCSWVDRTKQHRQMPGESLGEANVFYVSWVNLRGVRKMPALPVAREMVRCTMLNYCEAHGKEFLARLDFSKLAGARTSTNPESQA